MGYSFDNYFDLCKVSLEKGDKVTLEIPEGAYCGSFRLFTKGKERAKKGGKLSFTVEDYIYNPGYYISIVMSTYIIIDNALSHEVPSEQIKGNSNHKFILSFANIPVDLDGEDILNTLLIITEYEVSKN